MANAEIAGSLSGTVSEDTLFEVLGEVFVVGGEAVYREALPLASRVLMTEIALSVQGDAHFPALDPQAWVSLTRAEHTSATGIAYAIIDYRRR